MCTRCVRAATVLLMRTAKLYHPGGYNAEHPSGNVLEELEWDDDESTPTFRRFDEQGNIVEERPATEDDRARFAETTTDLT